jgi:hypothetical protein
VETAGVPKEQIEDAETLYETLAADLKLIFGGRALALALSLSLSLSGCQR